MTLVRRTTAAPLLSICLSVSIAYSVALESVDEYDAARWHGLWEGIDPSDGENQNREKSSLHKNLYNND